VFALLLSWRAAPQLVLLDLGGLATALALPLVPRTRLLAAGLLDFVLGGIEAAGGVAAGGARMLFGELELRELTEPLRSGRGTAIVRGLLVATPLVALFATLFATADAVFGQLLADSTPTIGGAGPHLLRVAVCAWIAAGVLWLTGARSGSVGAPRSLAAPGRLGTIEVTLVLGLLDALFAAFVLVQFRAFFGGGDWVRSHAHLTYAQYARHGFFQLLVVAGLALVVVLLLDWSQERRTRATTVLALAFVLLVGAVMASALQRMRLYQREYGLTELRVYSTAFMLWLAVVLSWLAATVLRGRRERFAAGLVLSGLLAIAALNVANPDRLIARVNLDRAAQGKPVDLAYLHTLSPDAVPALAGRAPADVVRGLAECDLRWRSWNLSRLRARDLACG
jgi:hypothetical protein